MFDHRPTRRARSSKIAARDQEQLDLFVWCQRVTHGCVACDAKRDVARDIACDFSRYVTRDSALHAMPRVTAVLLPPRNSVQLLRKQTRVMGLSCWLQGGRAEIVSAAEDCHGLHYLVRLTRSGRLRYARACDLRVIMTPRQPKNRRDAANQAIRGRRSHAK